jgi:hypothetical protein
MKIGDLDRHCGDCAVIGYCGNAWGYCLCRDSRFEDTDEEEYEETARDAPGIEPYEDCKGCTRPDCGPYRYDETDYADESCEHEDEARDFRCEQTADYVHKKLRGRQRH